METKVPTIRSEFQIEKDQRNEKIYKEYTQLINQPGAGRCAVNAYILKKYGLRSTTTLYAIIRSKKEQ